MRPPFWRLDEFLVQLGFIEPYPDAGLGREGVVDEPSASELLSV